jgi:opacity protein-like surface antigen
MFYRILRYSVILILVSTIGVAEIHASDFSDRLSGNFGVGAYSATTVEDNIDSDGNTIRRSSGTGYLASVGVSYKFSDHFSDNLSLAYSYRTYTVERYDSTGSRIGFTESNGVNQYSLVDTVQLNILPDSSFDIYLKAGPGLYFTNSGGDTEEDDQDTETTLGATIGTGIIIKVSSLVVVIEAQYHYYDLSDTEKSALSFGFGGGF